ncbi:MULTISPECIES: DUF1176 domain-containing protein [unclassified Serratia (in: enterobacteria)]|uniref:DUF1176 domain-containing protein n=1 Tax=unclassified Serratia (in: enterobacteria) TaxID=2647522 RepID=UPI0030764890
MRFFVLFALGLLATGSSYAAPLKGFFFSHKDWEVACDNTGTCRAAGYGAGSEEKVSILLTRHAGTNDNVEVEVAFNQQAVGDPPRKNVKLFINDKSEDILKEKPGGYFLLNYEQGKSIITALRQSDKVEFLANGERVELSTAGSDAVFLKMDEFQKRIGTLSALLRPGKNNNDHVLPSIPKPEIITRPVIASPEINSLSPAQLQKIGRWIQPTPEMYCRELEEGYERVYDIIPVDKNYSLIRTECFDVSRFAMWLIDNDFKSRPQFITRDVGDYKEGKLWEFSGPIRAWVWDGRHFVLSDQYYDTVRLGSGLSIGGVWHLPTFVSKVRTQEDVERDNIALKKFYNAVMKEKMANPELPTLSKITEQFPLKKPMASFEISYAENAQLPATKPSADITDDEWQAFLHSNISTYTETGTVNFRLVDLDNDGKRDLIVDAYVGGTGLFRFTGVLKRGDTEFYSTNNDVDDNESSLSGELFSENGRGANQWSQWIEINGQVYALWFNGMFGEDNLYLIRPFNKADKTAVITLRYHYQLDAIGPQEEGKPLTPALSNKGRKDLLKSLEKMQRNLFTEQPVGQINPPICPVPPGTSPEEAERYSMGFPLHYSYEPVAKIPVWLNGHCYIGTVASSFGHYNHGVYGEIILLSPEKDEESIGGYTVTGLRKVTSVTSGYKEREGDNGVP